MYYAVFHPYKPCRTINITYISTPWKVGFIKLLFYYVIEFTGPAAQINYFLSNMLLTILTTKSKSVM